MKIYLAALLIVVGCTEASAYEATICPTVDICLQQLPTYAEKFQNNYHSLNREQSAFIEHAVKLGNPLVGELIPLLQAPNLRTANMAAAILRDVDHIDSKYLPNIISGLDRDLGWLAPALGRIDSPKAAEEAVKRYLPSRSAPYNQEAFAVELLGARAAPYIAKAAMCEYGCKNPPYSALKQLIASTLKDEGKKAIAQELVKALSSKEISPEMSEDILDMFWSIGPAGVGVEAQLLKLLETKPNLSPAIDNALVGIGSAKSGKIFLEALKKKGGDIRLLNQVASRGHASHDAGPEVVKLLDSADVDLRYQALISLGQIGYSEAAEEIAKFVWDPVDVRSNYAAVVALGNFHDEHYRDYLLNVSNNHWYPPVREAAAAAISRINDKNSNAAYDNYELGDVKTNPSCQHESHNFKIESRNSKLYKKTDSRKLKGLKFTSEIISYGAADEDEQREKAKAKGQTPIIEVNESNMVEIRKPITQIPRVALKIPEGWFAGSDNGEWGGNLVFIDKKGKSQKILEENIEDIYEFGERYIAVTGLSHLGYSHGEIYEIYKENKLWHARKWRILPSAPMTSGLLDTGDLLITSYESPDILLAPDGQFRMDCK